MTRSPFLFLRSIVAFSFVVASIIYSSSVLAQQASEDETAIASVDIAAAATPTDIFLELAGTVGQTAAAQRLIDFKLKNDPNGVQRYYAVVDFDQPSTSKRFYVFDTAERKVKAYYVAHGKGSEGASNDGFAEIFSNRNGSNSSSLGIYRGLNEYRGQHGRSLRLEGLEETNSNALARAVVMHTADYVSESFIRRTGRLGRSQGCFAVEKSVGDALIDALKNGAYIIAAKN
jgi:hypothetical protein